MTRPKIDVYGYLDYRAYLRDFYAERKRHGRGFSYRAFSRRAGLSSPNHLKRVVDGDRNLSEDLARRFAEACRLEGEAIEYFCELVRFNQARTSEERRRRHQALRRYRGYRRAQRLDEAHAAYHSHWYVPAIRELAASRGFRDDPAWIAKRLVPSIKPAQARKALDVLCQLGLLVRDGEGRLVQSESVVSTGPETSGVHIVSYHENMMRHAIRSIDLIDREYRDISALTLCVSRDGLAELKRRIQEFRKELVGLEGADGRGSIVVQINFQLFPLTEVPQESEPCDSL